MTNVRIQGRVEDLSPRAVPAFIGWLQPILSAAVGSSWQLNLDGGDHGYFGPTAAVVVASSLLLAKTQRQQATVTLPQAPPALAAFCMFSGLTFIAQHGELAAPPATDPPESETAPLQQFRKMNWGGSTPLVRLIRRHLPGLGSDSEDLLRTCYSEIVQNIEDHSQSPIGGVICARYFTNLHEIRIAVADRGIGIGESLRQSKTATRMRIRDDSHALELVLQGGVTSKSRANNMGQGISNLAAIASGNGGRLMILSGNAHAVVDSENTHIHSSAKSAFPGTLVLLSLRVSTGDPEPDDE